MFQSPDGDFVYSDEFCRISSAGCGSTFQSPDGDFVYSDKCFLRTGLRHLVRFNPLTGISSILTFGFASDANGL